MSLCHGKGDGRAKKNQKRTEKDTSDTKGGGRQGKTHDIFKINSPLVRDTCNGYETMLMNCYGRGG